jgi:diaminopropionate ammonia-lyase
VTVVGNDALDLASVPPAAGDALAFHQALTGYAPTPVRELPAVAAELGIAAVLLKDESDRLGLPAFKVLGASWAIERTLRADASVRTLIAASAGNHGRAVAHVARLRGVGCRIFLPARSAPARREAIESEGAEVVLVDGTYEEAVGAAAAAAHEAGAVEIADVGRSTQARWVIDGYATLFAELADQAHFDLMVVPVGVGSLAAAAVRFAAPLGIPVLGVEPETAACLTASLAAGEPTAVLTPGTTLAGLDCAEISPSAWPSLRAGITGMVTVTDAETHEAMRDLAALGLAVGDCGAAPLAALRHVAGLPPGTKAMLIATEGRTDPDGYRAALGPR